LVSINRSRLRRRQSPPPNRNRSKKDRPLPQTVQGPTVCRGHSAPSFFRLREPQPEWADSRVSRFFEGKHPPQSWHFWESETGAGRRRLRREFPTLPKDPVE